MKKTLYLISLLLVFFVLYGCDNKDNIPKIPIGNYVYKYIDQNGKENGETLLMKLKENNEFYLHFIVCSSISEGTYKQEKNRLICKSKVVGKTDFKGFYYIFKYDSEEQKITLIDSNDLRILKDIPNTYNNKPATYYYKPAIK